MSTNENDIHPLLTEQQTHPHLIHSKKTNKLICITVVLIVSVVIFLLITYTAAIWPFISTHEASKAGIYGKYPVWGGNIQNRQISINSQITQKNVFNLSQLCIYTGLETDLFLRGYIVVDNQNNGYFGDTSGFVRSINLDSCEINWSVFINDILNHTGPGLLNLYNTPTLYRTNNDQQAMIFGASALMRAVEQIDESGCYAVALNTNDGSVLWSNHFKNNLEDSPYCILHGFMVEKQFAYGGMSSMANLVMPNSTNLFVGKMIKINLNNGEIIHQFYTLPIYNNSANYAKEGFYSGVSVWPFGAVIDEFVVFGTGNLYTFPRNVEQCMLGNVSFVPMSSVYEYNLCAQDMRENHLNWRCLEKNVL
eukprot:56331_1